jgi:hypothetical protein
MTITNGYTTLADVKALLRVTSTDATDDGVMEELITQASRIIDGETRRTFYARSETKYFDTPEGVSLFIDNDDLLTITTLTNGSGTVITSAKYKLYPLNSSPKYEIRLLGSSGVYWEYTSSGDADSAITIAGTWGYASSAPADITGACNDIVVTAYHKRFGENVTGAATVTGAGVVITPKDIPDAAWKTLKRYMRGF